MGASKAVQAASAQKVARAIALKNSGMSWTDVAKRAGYSDRGAACKAVTRELAKRRGEVDHQLEIMREQEGARLDALQATLWPAAEAGNRKAIETILKICDRRCKLYGLDAPTKHEVVTMDAIDAEIARITAELGAHEAGQAAGTQGTPD